MTLTEVAVVIAVLLVMAAIGWSSMRGQLPRFRAVQASKQLKADLIDLRELAVRSNRETRMRLVESGGDCMDGSDWGGAWELQIGNASRGSTRWDTLPEDALEDGSDDETGLGTISLSEGGNRETSDACLAEWGAIRGPGDGENQDAIVFSPRGWVRNPASDFGSSGYIMLQLVNTEAARQGNADVLSVLVSRAGMVRLSSNRGDDIGGAVGTGLGTTAE